MKNRIRMAVQSLSDNVAIIRVAAAAFAAQADLTLNEIDELKVAVSEAVSNAIIHGYGHGDGVVDFEMSLYGDRLEYIVTDQGKGIEDVALARQPSYSTDGERMGLGFVFMESFMDELQVESSPGRGTTVRLVKKIQASPVH